MSRRQAGEGDIAEQAQAAKSVVQSLAKGFRVLEAFTDEYEDLTLSEIAELTGLDAGTTFRLLNTLVALGYIRRDARTRRFSLTLKILDLGFHAIGRRDIRAIARPVLRRLVANVGEAVSLAVLEGTDVLYIERVRAGLVRLGVDIRIGTTIPAHISVIGQCILAFLPETEFAVYATASRTVRHSFRDQRTVEDVAPILAIVRERGYLLGPSTLTEGLSLLAIPVLDNDGLPIGAISIAAPMTRHPLEVLETALGAAKQAAHEIARSLEADGSIGSSP
ncbi:MULTISPECIES: IclR family transcriptional regulator [unclassified Acidocella]|uniref:IclR family transcriptional regulator n=1 Tax=unclassified Acidocella TaxID=2648610 RepID=UPI00028E92C6|nr:MULTISPECIES: IclR family transcriptional regulator [unclassified Acidocella]EKM98564.1 regulatory protein IclR [Acidocella sp. MX-AZ02]WBO59052.1 IclR family transcriptional regulator [Acidocella sp. MX-AZ03]